MDKSYRYKQLDALLQYEDGYTLNELILRLDDDISGRTVQREIEKIQRPPYNAKLVQNLYKGKERLFRYEDTSFSLFGNSEDIKDKFRQVLDSLDSLAGIPQYDWMRFFMIELSNGILEDGNSIVSFENNLDLIGLKHLNSLAKAIAHHQPLKILYQAFEADEIEVHLHPYHLRQYNNRWFLLGRVDGKEYIGTYPLDRINAISDFAKPYVGCDIDIEDLFEDIVGVSVPKTDIEEILLKISNRRYSYIKTKPLHGTQREIKDKKTQTHSFVTIKVKINKELVSLLASYGADIEVIYPQVLRETMRDIATRMYNAYTEE